MKLIVNNLTKSFDKKSVLRGITYSFEKGRIYGLLGRNGAGKTTMFNCIAENLPLDCGEVNLQLDDGTVRPAAFDDIGFVFTQPHLPEFMTGYEFIKYFIDINKSKINRNVNIDEIFAYLDFEKADSHKLIRDYSHGMQNKLQFMAFLILRPSVILLDEPLTSFDVVVAMQIKNMIKSIKHDHIIIFSTHIHQLAQDLCDEIVILHNGVLSPMDAAMLHDEGFEQQIMELLKDEGNSYD